MQLWMVVFGVMLLWWEMQCLEALVSTKRYQPRRFIPGDRVPPSPQSSSSRIETKLASWLPTATTTMPPPPSSRLSPFTSRGKSFRLDEWMYAPPAYLTNVLKTHPHRRRWSVRELAHESGADLRQAERDAMALAFLTGARMEVTRAGDVLYTFPNDFGNILRQKSMRLRLERIVHPVYSVLSHVYRASFGIVLISSIAIVCMAGIVAMSSITTSSSSSSSSSTSSTSRGRSKKGSGNDDDDGGDSDDGGHRHRRNVHSYRRQRDPSGGFYVHIDLGDVLYLLGQKNLVYQDALLQYRKQGQLSFLRSIYSFLFGDGNPNAHHYAEHVFPAAVRYIQRHDGFLTAEELALFLPQCPAPPPPRPPSFVRAADDNDNDSDEEATSLVSESFVVPLLLRYAGTPVVCNDSIIYHFPDLVTISSPSSSQSSSSSSPSSSSLSERQLEPLLETTPTFTLATTAQVSQAMLLGLANAIGVFWLGDFLAKNQPRLRLLRNANPHATTFWGTMEVLYPFLQVYSVAYILTPIVRWLYHERQKADVQEQNRRRYAW